MPNHVHGILTIVDSPTVGANNHSPFQRPRGTSKTLGSIIRGFKIGVTKWMRNHTTFKDVWQRNYWEHIVRNESELASLREYIRNNPGKWELDRLNPCRGESSFVPTRNHQRNDL
jgi:REP element-mobilizing transposase RayT